MNDPVVSATIRAAGADAFVVIAFGQKIGPALLADTFAINLHASLLPKYRGAAPINWAVMNGDPETGVSVIAITQRLDAGDLLARQAICRRKVGPGFSIIEASALVGAGPHRLGTLAPDREHTIAGQPIGARKSAPLVASEMEYTSSISSKPIISRPAAPHDLDIFPR